jgi:hypothetical protein
MGEVGPRGMGNAVGWVFGRIAALTGRAISSITDSPKTINAKTAPKLIDRHPCQCYDGTG